MSFTIRSALRFEGERTKGSRFIVDATPVTSEAEARDFVVVVAADFPDASHHCWALRISSPAIDRASDDGEPSGSAGRPILAQLVGRELVDTAVVVTRYFGGTKLGVGGLVRAYGGAAGAALDRAVLDRWVAMTEIRFTHDYAWTDAIERAINDDAGIVLNRTFAAAVDQHIRLPVDRVKDFAQKLADLTAGTVVIESNS